MGTLLCAMSLHFQYRNLLCARVPNEADSFPVLWASARTRPGVTGVARVAYFFAFFAELLLTLTKTSASIQLYEHLGLIVAVAIDPDRAHESPLTESRSRSFFP